jgi:hypothetical protein
VTQARQLSSNELPQRRPPQKRRLPPRLKAKKRRRRLTLRAPPKMQHAKKVSSSTLVPLNTDSKQPVFTRRTIISISEIDAAKASVKKTPEEKVRT